MRNKTATSFRLSSEARQLIDALTKRMGISQADVVEYSVREAAVKMGIPLPSVGEKKNGDQDTPSEELLERLRRMAEDEAEAKRKRGPE
jgi:antitoxin component of RelBE/YafQ-DinJ toxin-antitoxin module